MSAVVCLTVFIIHFNHLTCLHMHCFSSILWVYFDPPAPLPRWDVIFWNWSNSLVGQVTFLSLSSSVNTRRTFAIFQLWISASPVAVTRNLLPVWHCMVSPVSECDLSTSCFYLISLWVHCLLMPLHFCDCLWDCWVTLSSHCDTQHFSGCCYCVLKIREHHDIGEN